ncbi:MAG: PIN domain-containing protein [Candidatus Aminicenantes bacterium]|jgi:predicted nucleic acid-binding protein
MPDKIFIDSNIFIYAKVEHAGSHNHELAKKFLKELEGKIIISIQVLNEFYNVLGRFKIADRIIQENIKEILKEVHLETITLDTIKLCWKIKIKHKYSYFDSLIIASALENDCSVLYSEDMHHDQLIEKKLKIINPLL